MAVTDRDAALRAHLRKLLDWEDAHAGFDSAIEGIPADKRGAVPEGLPHSPWQLLATPARPTCASSCWWPTTRRTTWASSC